jgi:formyltetrahydrofolate hydrolase
MEKVSLNEFKDCIVDEQNNIVAEKPRWFDRHRWEQGEMLVNEFNIKLNIADVMHRFYQQIAKEHEVHTDRIMLAITDNGRFFQAYVTNEQETELRYLQDYVITNGV